MSCPSCHAQDQQVRDGLNASGTQRKLCRFCGCRYTPYPAELGYPDRLRERAVRMTTYGMKYREVGRLLGIHHTTIIDWVRPYGKEE